MDISKEVKDFFSLRKVRITLIVIVGLLVAFLLFDAGMAVGARRAFEIERHDPHAMPEPLGFDGFGIPLPHGFMPSGHGLVGTISAVSLPTITIAARDGTDEMASVGTSTNIRNGSQTLQPSDLKAGENVIIIGEPSEAGVASQQIEARLIRILPQ